MEYEMDDFDAIIIGSGMGGMTCAAALSRLGRKVLMLEQFTTLGGQTHSFSRNGFQWDAGLHYLGGLAPDAPDRAFIDWLSGGKLEFAPMGAVYDTLHFPGGFTLQLSRPEAAQRLDLKERFPDRAEEIDAWYAAMHEGARAAMAVFQSRSLPEPFASTVWWFSRAKIERWCGRTLGDVIAEVTQDPKLAAILSAQWGDHGGAPNAVSFAVHALTVGSYLASGGHYPVGGGKAIAEAMIPVIEQAGGKALPSTRVTKLIMDDGVVKGVETAHGDKLTSDAVVSAIGAHETVASLLPAERRQSAWAQEILSFDPSPCHFSLYLGFEGEIEGAGATRSHHWIYDKWSTGDLWDDVRTTPPMLFVSFASLKDPAHDAGPRLRHSGEIVAFADWAMVARWADMAPEARGDDYVEFKAQVERALLDGFARCFPRLPALIAYKELSTPLATASITGHRRGGFYGLAHTPRRMMSAALRPKTPIPGLVLGGQDVVTEGILGAMWGGLLAAAAVDPRVFHHLRG
jgi:all-trans-retinol 13,14-reductase